MNTFKEAWVTIVIFRSENDRKNGTISVILGYFFETLSRFQDYGKGVVVSKDPYIGLFPKNDFYASA